MPRKTQRILIVDDDPVITTIYRKKFSESGFEAQTADGAAKAVQVLQEFQPDVVLLDLNMPGRSGAELLANLRAVPKYRDLPVVIITGEPEDSPQLAAAAKSAVTGILHKDQWNPDTVLAAVQWALDQPQRQAARKSADAESGAALDAAGRYDAGHKRKH